MRNQRDPLSFLFCQSLSLSRGKIKQVHPQNMCGAYKREEKYSKPMGMRATDLEEMLSDGALVAGSPRLHISQLFWSMSSLPR